MWWYFEETKTRRQNNVFCLLNKNQIFSLELKAKQILKHFIIMITVLPSAGVLLPMFSVCLFPSQVIFKMWEKQNDLRCEMWSRETTLLLRAFRKQCSRCYAQLSVPQISWYLGNVDAFCFKIGKRLFFKYCF